MLQQITLDNATDVSQLQYILLIVQPFENVHRGDYTHKMQIIIYDTH